MSDTYSRSGASPPGSKIVEPTYEGDFVLDGPFELESGRALACPTLHYAVYGRLNAARNNAVLICHALSGSALVGSWWPEIFAPGAVLSLEHDFVICINMLGSCYGSTGPGSVNPDTGETYGPDFPLVSVRDNVRAQAYPAMLVFTGLWDSQVQYYEPAKWVAKLRANKTDDHTLVFSVDMAAGHGGKAGRFQRLDDTALEYAFILRQLGIDQ